MRVVVAMSGGVDSSVAAHLLREEGHEVVGLFMRTGAVGADDALEQARRESPRKIRGCCSAIDAADARRVADRLDVPFYALNFADDFGRIKDYFADEYLAGRTPNPCVVCNTWLKFGRLWDHARSVGADAIATGHYAQMTAGAEGPELRRAVDGNKDQTYFLFGLRPDLLGRILFPVGGLPKSEVRRIADEADLGVCHKPDSQEICFVPTGDYAGFVRQHRPGAAVVPGRIVDQAGATLGTHEGVHGFTVGQRKGLGVAVGEPRYVLEVNAPNDLVVIGPREALDRADFAAERVNWLTPPPTGPLACEVKIRHRHPQVPATVHPAGDGRVRVEFDQPQSAVTPGQAAVFYDADRCLGGAWIA